MTNHFSREVVTISLLGEATNFHLLYSLIYVGLIG